MILALTGPGHCGKDFVCREFIEYASGQGLVFRRYALADFLKEILCFVLSISMEELEARKDDPVAPTRPLMIDLQREVHQAG